MANTFGQKKRGINMNTEEEQVSNCCTAPFGYPGWPDNDICSASGEHADIEKGEYNG